MGEIKSLKLVLAVMLVSSFTLNVYFLFTVFVVDHGDRYGDHLTWSIRAAAEAEEVAAISCSGHGRVYLDGLRVNADKPPICECSSCFVGPDCYQTLPDCVADADSGNPYFLEPFWMRKAASSAVLTAGWHRMGYVFSDGSYISKELEKHIRKLHATVGNAVTRGRYIIFGVGSTQLLNAAVHALSQNSSSPAKVVASIPFYPIYKEQTEYFRAMDFRFGGDVSFWRNNSDATANLIEFVTSPNNPDGQLKKADLQGPNVEYIYDQVYYWPHFTAISAQADEDIMLFSISKITGHAGSRFGVFVGDQLSWSRRAAAEAEEVAAISCSGHGRVYLDGLRDDADKLPTCECNDCFVGPDCSQSLPDCVADADSGNPYFLEPFWMRKAASSAVLTAGWHRMGYVFSDGSFISKELEKHIRELHATVGNAVTQGRYVIFGVGSTQLINAAVHALSPQNSTPPVKVVASVPYYQLYKQQTEYSRATDFKFGGDVSLWRNNSDACTNFIEFVNSPNNPDGQLKKAVLHGPNVEYIYDRVYYWPHYTAISAQADEDIMVFSISKLSGHAGSRFGWAVVKDENVFQRMSMYVSVNTMGVSRDSQLRALQLIKVVLKDRGKEIFSFGYRTLSNRWEELNKTLSISTRFTLQEIGVHYCNFSHKIRGPSPAYAWLKCEREDDVNCYTVLKAANILGRRGSFFGAEERYVRLSLLKTQDDFDVLVHRLKKLVSEASAKAILMAEM